MAKNHINEDELDVFGLFDETSMSYEDAEAKVKAENFTKTPYFKIDKDGDYTVRVLPLAPVMVDGKPVLDRKGYEYPLTSYLFSFNQPGKTKPVWVSVIDPRLALPNVNGDIVYTYLQAAKEALAGDEDAIESLTNIQTKGGAGLRASYSHCMYVIDPDDSAAELQILQISNSQYTQLETVKMATWKDLNKGNRSNDPVKCPLSDPQHGYDLIITKKGGAKPPLSFSLSRREDPVERDVLKKLLDADRLPDILYRYNRRSLEATIKYLQLVDEKYDLDIMDKNEDGTFANPEINACYEQIKLSLPADDHSHFDLSSSGEDSDDAEDGNKEITIEYLTELVEKHADAEKGSKEYDNVRDLLEGFIKNNNLEFVIRRYNSNQEALDGILEELNGDADGSDKGKTNSRKKTDDGNDDDEGSQQNDDTAEPAHRPARQRRQ